MPRRINLVCMTGSVDSVHVMGFHGLINIRLDMASGDRSNSVDLNEESARELFNWLGVWLHGGNRS